MLRITCRTGERSGWSAPSTIIIQGGNIGLQIGLGETDVVFTVMNASGENRLMKDRFTIGGEAAAMVGPAGTRCASANGRVDACRDSQLVAITRGVRGR